MPGTELMSCDHGSADLHQMRLFGGNCAFCARHPTLSEYAGGVSESALAATGVPQFGQKLCRRFTPLSAVLR